MRHSEVYVIAQECLSLTPRLERFRRRTVCPELDRFPPRIFELRPHVRRNEVAALDPLEPVPLQHLCVLCFQQSAGNSAGPEIDVSTTFFADRLLDRHVGYLHPSSGAKDAENFREHGVFVRNEIDYAVGDHDVDALVGKG
jgi:hypothetical protein